MKQETKELVFGAGLFLLCLVAFVFVVLKSHLPATSAEDEKYILFADFGKTDGLHIGDSVRIAGVNVGLITDAKLMSNYHVRLTMQFDKDYKIPDDSSIAVESDSIMGNKYLEIVPGGDDVSLPSGGSIIYSQDALILSDLIDLVISYANGKQEQIRKKCSLVKEKNK